MIFERNGNTLKNNTTDNGDISGGNIDKSSKIVNIYSSPFVTSPLKKKINQLSKGCLEDLDFKKTIKQLNHFLNPIDPEDQRDLETKLKNAGRADEILEAKELKEEFTKTLVKNNLSGIAQDVYSHILAMIKIEYDSTVKPLIKEKSSLKDIEKAVLDIVKSIYNELIGTELECDIRQVKGMLYFLTGNCHIDWKY